MENKTWIVSGEYLVKKPDVEKPKRVFSKYYPESSLRMFESEMEAYAAAFSSQPKIKRSDNGEWKEGDELEEGKDFEIWRKARFEDQPLSEVERFAKPKI